MDYDPGVQQVFLLESGSESSRGEPIKLLEVVDGTLEVGVEPIAFPGTTGTSGYPLVIVDVSPREYKSLRKKGNSVRFNGTVWKIARELAAR
jgi:hypothetical protein